MKKYAPWTLWTLIMTVVCCFFTPVTSYAATVSGSLVTVDENHISGQAWLNNSTNDMVMVELRIYKNQSPKASKIITIHADEFDYSLVKTIGNGYHGFNYKIDWTEFEGKTCKIEAYALIGKDKILLPGSKTYNIIEKTAVDIEPQEEIGPGISKKPLTLPANTVKKGSSLGMFTVTAYCSCTKCTAGTNLTYAGTVPKANHTISADINKFPIGTKLEINGTIYTVEDIGGSIVGNRLDIYYDSHEEALQHGRQSLEVFEVLN